MPELTMQTHAPSADAGSAPVTPTGSVPIPAAEDEGLSLRQIKWIPLIVPLAALTMLLGAAAVLGTA